MGPLTLYTLDDDFRTTEHGVVTLDQAFQALDKYSSLQHDLSGSAEHVISHSLYGLSLDKSTFLEISLEKSEYFVIKFETPVKRKLIFFTLPGLYQKEIDVVGTESMRHLTELLFALSVEEFKQTFTDIWESHRTKPWTHTT